MQQNRKIITVMIFVVTFCAPLLAQSPTISQTIKQLRQIKTDDDDSRVPVAARPLLTTLKQQLLNLISATIRMPENQQKTSAQLQAIILKRLNQSGVSVGYLPEDKPNIYTYGDIAKVALQHPRRQLNILAVTTTLGVCCGEDTSLYIFKRDYSRWQLVLKQEANNYEEVSGAQGRFRYAISKLDDKQNFFVVTARVNPWCTSNWQGLYYRVLRPGSQPDSPKILLAQKEIIYLGNDLPYKLQLTRNTFTLHFETEATTEQINNGMNYRLLTLKYAVIRNQVKKIHHRMQK